MCKNIPLFSAYKKCLRKDYISLEVDGFLFSGNLKPSIYFYTITVIFVPTINVDISLFILFLFTILTNFNMINGASNTSIMRTWLVKHTLHVSITVQRVCGNNFITSSCFQMFLRTILLHIRKMDYQCYVISNYFVGNTPLSIIFYWTVLDDPTLWMLYCINYLPCQISNSCYLIDQVSLSSDGQKFILFVLLKVKKFFIIHDFEFRYIILDNKFPSCIKGTQNVENNLVTLCSIGSWHYKSSFVLPESSPCFNCFNKVMTLFCRRVVDK